MECIFLLKILLRTVRMVQDYIWSVENSIRLKMERVRKRRIYILDVMEKIIFRYGFLNLFGFPYRLKRRDDKDCGN